MADREKTCERRAPSSFGEPIACCNPATVCDEHYQAALDAAEGERRVGQRLRYCELHKAITLPFNGANPCCIAVERDGLARNFAAYRDAAEGVERALAGYGELPHAAACNQWRVLGDPMGTVSIGPGGTTHTGQPWRCFCGKEEIEAALAREG